MQPNRRHLHGFCRAKVNASIRVAATIVIGALSLPACGMPRDPDRPLTLPVANPAITTTSILPTAIPTDTVGTGYPYPEPAPGSKQAFQTAVAEREIALATSEALTPEPTWTPGWPPIYPTETPAMGMLPGCGGTNSPGPRCYNRWRGLINGEITEVRAGVEGRDGDQTQGLVVVLNWHTHAADTYYTPQRVGGVYIVAVNGLRFTVAPRDLWTPGVLLTPWATETADVSFIFDLSTRQWVNP